MVGIGTKDALHMKTARPLPKYEASKHRTGLDALPYLAQVSVWQQCVGLLHFALVRLCTGGTLHKCHETSLIGSGQESKQ